MSALAAFRPDRRELHSSAAVPDSAALWAACLHTPAACTFRTSADTWHWIRREASLSVAVREALSVALPFDRALLWYQPRGYSSPRPASAGEWLERSPPNSH